MGVSSLRLVAALCWHLLASVADAQASDHATSTMPDAATRTYPTTLTTILSPSTLPATNPSVTTIDQVTLIDPWPHYPDPQLDLAPLTLTQTALTKRTVLATVLPPAPSPNPSATSPPTPITSITSTTLTATSTFLVWPPQPFDMPDYITPTCQYPDEEMNCSLRDSSIKPDSRCLARNRETRCARQCLLKDWMWFCATGELGAGERIGRVCEGGKGEEAVVLGEPCDHTDYAPGCDVCLWEGGDDGVWVGAG